MSDQAPAKQSPEPATGPAATVQSWLPTIRLTILSIVLALLVGAVLITVSDHEVLSKFSYFFADPVDGPAEAIQLVGETYWALLEGAFGSAGAITSTLERAAPLTCAGLGVTLAFRAGLFNIGANGQLIAGATAAAYVGFTWDLPPVLHLFAAVVAGLIGGAIWGGVVGLLKAKTGAHEVILTIMLNYVALQILRWCLTLDSFQVPGSNDPKSPVVDGDARFPDLLGMHSGVYVALLAAIGVWWLLSRSTVGFEMRAVGANPDASRTAGISISKAYIMAMVFAGMLAGLAGVQQVNGHEDPLTDGIAGELGFDAITVALLGRATPAGTVLAAILFGALSSGGREMQAATGMPLDLTRVLQALIVLFVAAPALVRGAFRVRDRATGGADLAKGWS